jgi:hypothetical protein
MALTLYKRPQELTPAYNNQIFTVLSDEIDRPGFKYIVNVGINGTSSIKQYLPRPDGWLVVDVKEWVQNFIEHYFNPELDLTSPIELAIGKTVEVEVTISEYYSGETEDITTTNYNAFDACLTDADFRNYNFEDYLFGQTTGKYFLSKTATTITPDNRLTLNRDMYLHFINASVIDNLVIELRRPNEGTGVLETIDTITVASIPAQSDVYEMYVVRLNSAMFTTVPAQVGDTVRVNFKDATTFVYRYTIVIKDICTKYTDNILYYLDRDGNILFFHFDKISKNNFTKKTNSVTLNADRLNTTTGEYGSNTWDRENHIVSTAIESTILLNTDWITETQSRQLNDLWSSPQVWLHNGTDLLAVTITNNGYEEIKSENESLFQYNVTVNTGVVENRQRGI